MYCRATLKWQNLFVIILGVLLNQLKAFQVLPWTRLLLDFDFFAEALLSHFEVYTSVCIFLHYGSMNFINLTGISFQEIFFFFFTMNEEYGLCFLLVKIMIYTFFSFVFLLLNINFNQWKDLQNRFVSYSISFQ